MQHEQIHTNLFPSRKLKCILPRHFSPAFRASGKTFRGRGKIPGCSGINKRYFPRNTASLIENLEIKINGQSRQNINQYNYIYNILNDYSCGYDATGKNRIGQNADPSSNKTTYNADYNDMLGFQLDVLIKQVISLFRMKTSTLFGSG
jgi:hypothetical protein